MSPWSIWRGFAVSGVETQALAQLSPIFWEIFRRMTLRYSPVRAFAALYAIATLAYSALCLLLRVIAPEALGQIASSGVLIYPLFLIAFVAAKQAVMPHALPVFAYPQAAEVPRRRRRVFLAAAFSVTALGIELVLSALSYGLGLSSTLTVDPIMAAVYAIIFAVVCFKGMGEARPGVKSKVPAIGDGLEASPEVMLARIARQRMDGAAGPGAARAGPSSDTHDDPRGGV